MLLGTESTVWVKKKKSSVLFFSLHWKPKITRKCLCAILSPFLSISSLCIESISETRVCDRSRRGCCLWGVCPETGGIVCCCCLCFCVRFTSRSEPAQVYLRSDRVPVFWRSVCYCVCFVFVPVCARAEGWTVLVVVWAAASGQPLSAAARADLLWFSSS